ncbi:hypothetical protein C8Q80DRAFT_1210804, partial [Daedaleopsis nitida]
MQRCDATCSDRCTARHILAHSDTAQKMWQEQCSQEKFRDSPHLKVINDHFRCTEGCLGNRPSKLGDVECWC